MNKTDIKEKSKEIVNKLRELYPQAATPLNYSNPWELYVAVALSAQQTDIGVNKVTDTLFKKYKTLDDYVNAKYEDFDNDIKTINFHKGKAKAILEAAKLVKEKYKGQIPDNMDELITLPFVGRKTANVILQEAYGKSEGVVVDTHVKRLATLLGLTTQKDPVKIEKELMEVLERSDWRDFSLCLILYGREHCKASCKHTDCPLRIFIAK